MTHSPPPSSYAYWVLPGKFMAGDNPSTWFEDGTQQRVIALLNSGVTVFIDLTEPGEKQPYDGIAREQAGWMDKEIEYHRLAVRDMGTPSPALMERILDIIDAAIEAGKMVYVHCYAGIGRTGTVVGCYLVRHGMSGQEALDHLLELRKDISTAWRRSPETLEQEAFILAWKDTPSAGS
jgi:hypothetical protein